MPKWMGMVGAVVLALMAFAMTASTWLWLMGYAPYPGDGIMFGRVFLGLGLAGGAAALVGAVSL